MGERPRGRGRPFGNHNHATVPRDEAMHRTAEEAALNISRPLAEAAQQERADTVCRATLPTPGPGKVEFDPQTVPGFDDFTEEDAHERFKQLVAEDPSLRPAGGELKGPRHAHDDGCYPAGRKTRGLPSAIRSWPSRQRQKSTTSTPRGSDARSASPPAPPATLAGERPHARPHTFDLVVSMDLMFVPDECVMRTFLK